MRQYRLKTKNDDTEKEFNDRGWEIDDKLAIYDRTAFSSAT